MSYAQMGRTPGYFYAIAYGLAVFSIVVTKQRRWSNAVTLVAGLLAYAALSAFMFFTDGATEGAFILSMCVIVVGIGGFIYATCDLSIRTAGFYTIKAFLEGELCSSFCWQLAYNISDKTSKGTQILVISTIYLISVLTMYFAEKKLQEPEHELNLSWKEFFYAFVIAISVFILSNSGYVFHGGLFSGSRARDIFIVRTLADLSGLAILYAFQIQMRELERRYEAQTLRSMLDMQYMNYKLSKDSINLVNQKYHDLKHQIAILKREAGTQKASEQLSQMEQEIRIYETQNRTGNKVLDTVLAVKSIYCQSHDIELKVIADGTCISFMKDMDVSALFGNILDNAIEGVKTQTDSQKRTVRLYLAAEKQFIRIFQENYCTETLHFKGGLPLTTKKDNNLHGFGMKSIQTIVEKYQGTVTANQEQDRFLLRILMPAHPAEGRSQ